MKDITPRKKSIFSWIKGKVEDKPITMEELQELKLKTIKLRLEADIAESKAIIKKTKIDNSMDTLNAIFGPMSEQGTNKNYNSKEKDELRRKTLGF